MARYQISIFFALVFIISWYPWYTGGHGYRTWGVSLAGLLVVAMANGWQGIKAMARRLVKVRVGFRWWAVGLLGPLFIYAIAIAIHVLLGGAAPSFKTFTHEPLMILVLMLVLLTPVGGPGGEEYFGWRGYAQAKLQEKWGIWGPLMTSLIIGFAWGVWHLPEFFNPASSQYALGFGMFVPFIIMEIANSIIITWIYNKTGGSVLVSGVLWHLMIDTGSVTILDATVTEMLGGKIPSLDVGLVGMVAIVMTVASLMVLIATRGRL